MNLIHLLTGCTVAFSLGTTATADIIYNHVSIVSFQVGDGEDGQPDWSFYDSNETSFDVTYVDDFLGTSLTFAGDQNGFSLTNDGLIDNWWVILGIDVTFETETLVSVTMDYEGDAYELINTSIDAGDFAYSDLEDPWGLGGYIHLVDVPGEYTLNVSFTEVPAPGTLVLLSIAGLTSSRRRS